MLPLKTKAETLRIGKTIPIVIAYKCQLMEGVKLWYKQHKLISPLRAVTAFQAADGCVENVLLVITWLPNSE